MEFSFTLWDVEHGLSIWIQTPSGQNHCIDAGHNSSTNFSPFEYMKTKYNINSIDLLTISHPDKDHIEGLPNFINYLGYPNSLLRNKSLPDEMKYGSCNSEYQKIFKLLDSQYNYTVPKYNSSLYYKNNGNVNISHFMNCYQDGMKCNDTSVIMFYEYKDWVFVCPGDIEPSGWDMIKNAYYDEIETIVYGATVILVAPHHGRPSAYCKDMINLLHPNLVLISDKYGKHETDRNYYTCASGLYYKNNIIQSVSTKTKGKIKITIDNDGKAYLFTAS